jgi:hypothetical protein
MVAILQTLCLWLEHKNERIQILTSRSIKYHNIFSFSESYQSNIAAITFYDIYSTKQTFL